MAKISERNLGQTGEGSHIKKQKGLKKMCTLEFQIEMEGGINREAGKFRPK